MYHLHRNCRACQYGPKPTPAGIKSGAGSDRLIEVLDLGIQPLANDFQDESGNFAGFAPLKVLFCPRCSLAQLSVVVRPDILYSNYSYTTSTSATMLRHFVSLWKDIQTDGINERILEIGSNTGKFLKFVGERGARQVLGIDPAENLCEIATRDNLVPTICKPFNRESAKEAAGMMKTCDAVVARHVFCHIDDWKTFVENLKLVGRKDTLFCIEVPYAPDMLKMNSFDQIYHEHLSYLTVRSVNSLLDGSGLHIHNVRKYPIHGGAIVIFLRWDESDISPVLKTWSELISENVTAEDWKAFAARAKEQQQKLKATIEVLLAQGKTVVGFGASAKSTVWINACGLTRKHLRFICDSTPQKQYKLTPGTDIPIVDEGALLRELPDYAVCFAWNFLPEIQESQKVYIEKGGKFIVPVPEVKIAG